MTERLPLLSAQLAFAMYTQRSDRKAVIALRFRTPPARLATGSVRAVLRSLVLRNPALSHRIVFSQGSVHQEWYPAECEFAELRAPNSESRSQRVLEAIEESESATEGPPISARLIRSPECDELVLVLDHAFVDEQSLELVKRQLAAPAEPDRCRPTRYREAVEQQIAAEAAAAGGPGIEFWADRLETAGGSFPKPHEETARFVPVRKLPSVAVPAGFRGSPFPYVLYSLHRALQDVGGPGPTVIGYPWANRPPSHSDVVGCFMNTVLSIAPGGPARKPEDFVAQWHDEIEHADVPYTAVAALGPVFHGAVAAYLDYTHVADLAVPVAGVPAVRVPQTHVRTPPTCAFQAAAVVSGDALHLRLSLDERITGYGAREFGSRWHHWLAAAISTLTEAKSSPPTSP
ncbi:hypothetical protein MUY14_05075 [Amycolatopsis sp. FBCC-B4732]|uniref:hypothetical protein n=1 Tax=Amycolatopsis sp. FBCC-B4732 TaxID=3079339 RepID=UPI001FF5B644|nr:hypothetical protein [Amycolatopsis sp. FBCC-B4732]UOX90011.1 hypothetical protein MUY14_05075 [Amycolatopsis sp. FBCC-B4732]